MVNDTRAGTGGRAGEDAAEGQPGLPRRAAEDDPHRAAEGPSSDDPETDKETPRTGRSGPPPIRLPFRFGRRENGLRRDGAERADVCPLPCAAR